MSLSFIDVLQWTSQLMIIPSTLLTILLVYVILKKSPKSMSHYKYILIFITMICYNFDFVVCFAVAPNNFSGVVGAQMVGPVARLFSTRGFWLGLAVAFSLCLQIGCCTLGFLYREHVVTGERDSRLQTWIRAAQLLLFVVSVFAIVPVFSLSVNSEQETRRYLQNISLVPCEGCAVVVVTRPVTLQIGGIYSLFYLLIVSTFIGKSIYRITSSLSDHKHMSISTIRLQRMLLKALIWQTAMPFLLIIVPVLIIILNLVIFPYTPGFRPSSQFRLNIMSLAIATPSLFTITHVICVLYFTTPYKSWLFRCRRHCLVEASSIRVTTSSIVE